VNTHPNTSGLRRGGGRPKGVPNKVTADARRAANALIDDPAYRATLRQRLIAGTLPPADQCQLLLRAVLIVVDQPAVETLLWTYAKGMPKPRLEPQPPASTQTTAEALKARVAALRAKRNG